MDTAPRNFFGVFFVSFLCQPAMSARHTASSPPRVLAAILDADHAAGAFTKWAGAAFGFHRRVSG